MRLQRVVWSASLAIVVLAAGCSSGAPPPVGPGPAAPPAVGDVRDPDIDPGPPGSPDAPPPPAPAGPTAGGPAPGTIAAALLAEHNTARLRHCARPLTWSPELAAAAQAWADHLRDQRCAFDHSRSPYGENLAAGTAGTLDAHGIVGMWMEERAAYDFARGGFSMATGHFTQVVWRGTTALGCGSATCNGMDLWVCNYDPPGNAAGAYAANVQPARCW